MTAPDLGRLGLVIEGAQGRREIQLTRDELMKLANGGREAAAVLKTVMAGGSGPPPPPVPPQINKITEAINRMRAAARPLEGPSFMRQLDVAELQRRGQAIDRLTQSLHRMREAGAQRTAGIFRNELSKQDPFQAGEWALGPQLGPALPDKFVRGSGAAAPMIQQINTAAATATFNVSKLRQGLTSLAVAATGVPGPIGQLASSLAPLALGGGITVGVLAGVTAITYAWKKFHEEGDRAAQMMAKLREGETGMSVGAMKSRMELIGVQIEELERKRSASGQRLAPEWVTDPRTGRRRLEDRWAPEFTGEDQQRRDELAGRYAELSTVVRREQGQSALEAGRKSSRDKWEAVNWNVADDPFARAPWRRGTTLEGMSLALGGFGSPIGGPTDDFKEWGETLKSTSDDVAESIRRFKDREFEATMRAAAALEKLDAQARQAGLQLAQYAIGQAASRFSPTSGAGILAQAAGGVIGGISGGPWGMLAGGVIGLASGLFGLSDASKEHRRAMQREQEARQRLVEAIDKETTVRNAPHGFFVENYYRPGGSSMPPGGGMTPIGPRPLNAVAGSGGGTPTVVLDLSHATFTFASGGEEGFRDFVRRLRAFASSTGGTGTTLGDALDMVPA